MIEAALWGFLGASSLVVGAFLAFRLDLSAAARGLILAFGAGTLLGAVAYELVEEAVSIALHGTIVGLGLAAGALTFFLGSLAIDRIGGAARGSAGQAGGDGDRLRSRRDPRVDGEAVVLGSVLDGIPESIVLGTSLLAGEGVSVAMLVAIVVSNVPEGLSASRDLGDAGIPRSRIYALWFGVAAASALAAGLGYHLLSGASPNVIGFVDAFTAGAILAMLAESMIPEATEIGGRPVGLATTFGFAIAALLSFSA
jgi:ZIP family zinc transporter